MTPFNARHEQAAPPVRIASGATRRSPERLHARAIAVGIASGTGDVRVPDVCKS
jgi:hypothetical protein